MKKVLAFTSIRSDYDLLSELYHLLNQDPDIEFKLLVSGAHLSKTYGYSVEQIRADGFDILTCIESLIDADSKPSRIKTASILLQCAIDPVAQYDPDLIIFVGDREDVAIAALIAGYLEIPSMHFWAGDHTTDGCIDNPVRHASSKFASIHMATTEQHKQRLIHIGEKSERIFTVGSIALDRFVKHQALTKTELAAKFNWQFSADKYGLVIFHPLHGEREQFAEHLQVMVNAMHEQGLAACVSFPNTDPGNKQGIELINQLRQHPNVFVYESLERDDFLSIYKNAAFIIGNSSSGILEAASIPIPTINVGKRQRDRFAPENVLYCDFTEQSILVTIEQAMSDSFLASIKNLVNPYGDGHSAERALELIKSLEFKDYLLKEEDPLAVH